MGDRFRSQKNSRKSKTVAADAHPVMDAVAADGDCRVVFMPGLRTALARFVWFSARAFGLLVGVPFLAFLLVRSVYFHAGIVWAAVAAVALMIVVLPGMYGGLLGFWLFRPRAATPAAVAYQPVQHEPIVHHFVQNIVHVTVVRDYDSGSPKGPTVRNVTEQMRLGTSQGDRTVD